MQLVEVTKDNIGAQHICCAISSAADQRAAAALKKGWMAERFAEGYHFCKLDVQGKVFVEYTPAENAWCPLIAPGWMFLDCFWVSGRYKGQGHAAQLLAHVIDAAKAAGCKGLVALTADKKRPFLSDPGFYAHSGFVQADAAPPYYRLVALPFEAGAPLPRFGPTVGTRIEAQPGIDVFYTLHCPHTRKNAELLQQVAQSQGTPLRLHEIATTKEAQQAASPFTTWAMYQNGEFVTNEIFSENKLLKYLQAQKG